MTSEPYNETKRTITITHARKERLARVLNCKVAEIDDIIDSGELDTLGFHFEHSRKDRPQWRQTL